MPDDELTQRFAALQERLLVDTPDVGSIERRGRRRQRARRAGAVLAVAAVALGAFILVQVLREGWPAGDLDQGPVSPAPPTLSVPPTTSPPTTVPSTTVPEATTTRAPTTTAASSTTTPVGLRILEPRPGTVVRPGQTVRMRAAGCPPNGDVRFEDGTSMRASDDGSFSTEFEIPPGPAGDFFLDANCGGITREVKLRRSP